MIPPQSGPELLWWHPLVLLPLMGLLLFAHGLPRTRRK